MIRILAGKITIVQAAREHGVSQTSIANWKRRFLAAAEDALANPVAPGRSDRLAVLQAEHDALTKSLHEVRVLERVWRISAQAQRNTVPPRRATKPNPPPQA